MRVTEVNTGSVLDEAREVRSLRASNWIEPSRPMTNDLLLANRTDEDPALFHTRFWRCYRLLHFVACRVLGSPERADDAIENCWRRTSRSRPRFEYEGAFRSWLVRVLIDEALDILCEKARGAQGGMDLRRDTFGA